MLCWNASRATHSQPKCFPSSIIDERCAPVYSPTQLTITDVLLSYLQSALFLAASERRPLVAGYLAETMSALRIPLNQTYEKGNTLIHYLSMWGDEFNEVLRYLVRIKTPDDKMAFDLNARNHTGTPKKERTFRLDLILIFVLSAGLLLSGRCCVPRSIGRSALHETVMLYLPNDTVGEGFIKNIQLLLENGADAGLSVFTIETLF